MINHTGTETRPRLLLKPAVRNIGQWAKAWSSNTMWGKTAVWP